MQCSFILFILVAVYNKVAVGNSSPKVSSVSVTSCEGAEKVVHLEFKPPDNGKQIWNGNLTFAPTIDSNTDFVWEMRWWKDGAWETKPQIFKGKACFYLEKFAGKTWKSLIKAAIPPLKSPCPVPSGTYRFDNFEADYNDIHLPMMKKGRWSGKITITRDGKTMCIFLVVDMV